jgi:acetolactate synthase-1/2/3 large subunit
VQLTGAQALIKSLEREGVDTIFGLPGGAILPVYDPIIDSSIRHILVRHEQGAGHMAEGYAMATGKPGVAMVTSGPGATNIVTPIGNAHMDSTPARSSSRDRWPPPSIGTDAFQECDITGVTMGITKHNWLIKTSRTSRGWWPPPSTSPRPGGRDRCSSTCPRTSRTRRWSGGPESIDELDLPGYHPVTTRRPRWSGRRVDLAQRTVRSSTSVGERAQIPRGRRAARLGRAHQDPGGHHADGAGRLPRLAPQHLGMPGMHGTTPR